MNKQILAIVSAAALLIAGTTVVQATETKSAIYVVCVDKKTKVLTQAKNGACASSKVAVDIARKISQPENGNSILSGAQVPAADSGKIGDFFLETNSYSLFGPKTSGGWGLPKSLVGPAGASGSSGSTGATGAAGTDSQLVALNKFPSGLSQLAKIQTETILCCEIANNNVALAFELYNNSGDQAVPGGLSTTNTQLWINYFDATGNRIYVDGEGAFFPTAWDYTASGNWDGSVWNFGSSKLFKILVTGVHAQKPANAIYYSITWRPTTGWVGTWSNAGQYSIAGDKLMTKYFHATGF